MSVGRHGIIALAIAIAFYLFEFVARIEPSLAIASIAEDFTLTNAAAGTLVSLFFWVYAPMQLVVGVLLDRYGARPLIVPALALCSGGVLLVGATDVVWLAALGRIATGLGASFAFVSALYVVNHNFAPSRFALLSGVVNMVGMFGTAVGAILLTDLIAETGWRSVFVGTGIVGLGLCAVAFIAFKEPVRDTAKTPEPALSGLGDILTNRRVWIIGLTGALYYMPVNVFGGLWGQRDLVVDHGLEPVSAELAVSMIFLGMALGSVAAGAVSDKIGHRRWIICSNAALSAFAYGAAINVDTSSVVLLASFLFLAGAFGGAQMLTFAMAKEVFATTQAGKVIAFVNMVGIAAAVIFQPLVGSLIDMTGENYRLALSAIPICALAAAVLILFVSERRHPDHH